MIYWFTWYIDVFYMIRIDVFYMIYLCILHDMYWCILHNILVYFTWYIDAFHVIYWCISRDILMYLSWYIDVFFFFLPVDCSEWHKFSGHWYLWDPTRRTFNDARVSKLQLKAEFLSNISLLSAPTKGRSQSYAKLPCDEYRHIRATHVKRLLGSMKQQTR